MYLVAESLQGWSAFNPKNEIGQTGVMTSNVIKYKEIFFFQPFSSLTVFYLPLNVILRLKIQVSKLGIEMSDINFSKSLNACNSLKTHIRLHLAHSLVSKGCHNLWPTCSWIWFQPGHSVQPRPNLPLNAHISHEAPSSLLSAGQKEERSGPPSKASFSVPVAADPGQHWELKGSPISFPLSSLINTQKRIPWDGHTYMSLASAHTHRHRPLCPHSPLSPPEQTPFCFCVIYTDVCVSLNL